MNSARFDAAIDAAIYRIKDIPAKFNTISVNISDDGLVVNGQDAGSAFLLAFSFAGDCICNPVVSDEIKFVEFNTCVLSETMPNLEELFEIIGTFPHAEYESINVFVISGVTAVMTAYRKDGSMFTSGLSYGVEEEWFTICEPVVV